MKTVMVFMVALSLFVTLGCNYDYGKYGKTRPSQSQNKKMKMERLLTKQKKLEEVALGVDFFCLFGFTLKPCVD